MDWESDEYWAESAFHSTLPNDHLLVRNACYIGSAKSKLRRPMSPQPHPIMNLRKLPLQLPSREQRGRMTDRERHAESWQVAATCRDQVLDDFGGYLDSQIDESWQHQLF